MKYKTLFRLMLKAIGVWVLASALPSLVSMIGLFLRQTSATRSFRMATDDWYFLLNTVASGLHVAFGLYLFFGGKWIVDKAIPSNRPYCHECGYDLTAATRNRCPECGTPFRPEDVMPEENPNAMASTASPGGTTDQRTTDPTSEGGTRPSREREQAEARTTDN